jgi:hypothetical protein
MAGIEPKQ